MIPRNECETLINNKLYECKLNYSFVSFLFGFAISGIIVFSVFENKVQMQINAANSVILEYENKVDKLPPFIPKKEN